MHIDMRSNTQIIKKLGVRDQVEMVIKFLRETLIPINVHNKTKTSTG